MTALFLIPLCATSLGGALALGALFYRSNDGRANDDASPELLDELERREQTLAVVNAELDAKRLALESLTKRATEAAATLGRVLDSFSTAFGDATPPAPTTLSNQAPRPTTFEPFPTFAFDSDSRLQFDSGADERSFRR